MQCDNNYKTTCISWEVLDQSGMDRRRGWKRVNQSMDDYRNA